MDDVEIRIQVPTVDDGDRQKFLLLLFGGRRKGAGEGEGDSWRILLTWKPPPTDVVPGHDDDDSIEGETGF